MAIAKRKSSPSQSSRSSATPAPVLQSIYSSNIPSNPSSPAELQHDDGTLQLPGPSRASQGSTPIPGSSSSSRDIQSHAKAPTLIAGSGDGSQHGDECFLWTDLPMNKAGFRYLACTPSPTESPIPTFPFYRTLPGPSTSPPIHISWLDRSSFLRVSMDGLTTSTDRGYRSGRANVSVREGTWYYEARIERGNGVTGSGGGTGGDVGNAHVRIGWGRREANLDAPVGLDGYSYGIRDTNGEKVHLSRPKSYGREFSTGDVIGCLISLPSRSTSTDPTDPATIRRKRIPINYKGQHYFEMDEYTLAREMEALVDREGKGEAAAKAAAADAGTKENKDDGPAQSGSKDKKGATTKNAKKGKSTPATPSGPVAREIKTLPGSSIAFYLNGQPLGEAFKDIIDFIPLPPIFPSIHHKKHQSDPTQNIQHDDGTLGYFPMISCFAKGKVKCNFGPDFAFPPPPGRARPISDRFEEFREEERKLDERDEEFDLEQMKKELKEKELEMVRRGMDFAVNKGKKPKKSTIYTGKRKKVHGHKEESTSNRTGTPGVSEGTAVKFESEGTPLSTGFETPPVKMEIDDGHLIEETPASPTAGSYRATSEATLSRRGSSLPASEGDVEGSKELAEGDIAEGHDEDGAVGLSGGLQTKTDVMETGSDEEGAIDWDR